MKKKITVYTDGGCSGNPGPGGWGFVVIEGKEESKHSGGEDATTNNRMELAAAINALKFVQQNYDLKKVSVNVFCDSQYVKSGITVWINNWKVRGWKTAERKPVKNMDLWMELDSVSAEFPELEWEWVKGHAGVKYNEICDELCQNEIKKRKKL